MCNERKYKYSLVSVLVIEVVVILSVNFGVAFRSCGKDAGINIAHLANNQELSYDTATKENFIWQYYRLPGNVVPLHYNISFYPNLTEHRYKGRVIIAVEVLRSIDTIVMHSTNHTITCCTIAKMHKDEEPMAMEKLSHCDANGMIALHFKKPLHAHAVYLLSLEFVSTLEYGLDGFYLSKYIDQSGLTHHIATSHFEPVAARSAFPCFDEPSYKANFSLSMVRDADHFTIFNTPLKESRVFGEDDGLMVDVFETSVGMSTYLVAFVLSNFKSSSCVTSSRVRVSVYSQPEKTKDTKYAVQFACAVLGYYEKIFKIPYPLPKLDLVAIPDFAAGAMENWGLVTYRETALLYDSSTSSLADKQWVAKVIAHELAHQWFGNLVTMRWWDDLWLNEGFASYMEFKGMNEVEKDWSVMGDFLLDHTSVAMDTDSFVNTHMISQETKNTLEIEQLFDTITYDKGACIIAMLIDWLGEDSFFAGITAYLNHYAYSNAANRDLITHLAAASPPHISKKVVDTIESFTEQAGLPLITVARAQHNKVTLVQSRFVLPSSTDRNQTEQGGGQSWMIPVSYSTSVRPAQVKRTFMSRDRKVIDLGADPVEWVKLNHEQAGYYRVSYDLGLWDGLFGQLRCNHLVFTSSDRVSLLSDAFLSAFVGSLDYERLLTTSADYLQRETSYAPLRTAITQLKIVATNLRFHSPASSVASRFRRFFKSLFALHYDRLAWKTAVSLSLQDVKLQDAVVQTLCLMDHGECVDEATRRFIRYTQNGTGTIQDPNWIGLIFNTALKYADGETWQLGWDRYLTETDPNLRGKLLGALSLTSRDDKIMFLHRKLREGVDIRSQDHGQVLIHTTATLRGAALTWSFVKRNWKKLTDIHGATSTAFRRIIEGCLRSLLNEDDVVDAEEFFVKMRVEKLKFIKKSLEQSRVRITWSKRHVDVIEKWLNGRD